MRTVFLALIFCAAAQAAPARRFALVVGANHGDADDQPLRFAEADAQRMGRVLRELGGFKSGDIVELKTPDAATIERALADLSARVSAETDAGRPPLVLFYFSGHADAEAMHSAGARISFEQLRGWLRDSRAGVRLAVLDSCRSGSLTRVKGMHVAPAIEVNLANDLSTRGEALLTSSTSDELARESDALRGSFFTHHLVSGLRGAADQSKDGRVTLAEAYDYAYGKTVAQASGGQHPTFKYDLAGRGDVVLTSLNDGGAWLAFAADSSGTYLILSDDGLLLGDVDVGHSPIKVAVAPGRYEIRKRTHEGDRTLHIVLGQGEERWIHDEELAPDATTWFSATKGELLPPAPPTTSNATDWWLTLERKRARSARSRAIGLLAAGVPLTLASVAVAVGGSVGGYLERQQNNQAWHWNDNPWVAPAAAAPIGIGMFLAGAALTVSGSILYRQANRDHQRAWGELTVEENRLAADRRAISHRRLGRGLLWAGVGTAVTGLAVALGAFGVLDSSQDATLSGLLATGVSAVILGSGVAIIGSRFLRRGQHYEEPMMLLSLAPLRDGGAVSLSGTF